MALILLRHTTPDVPPGTCYGQTDLELAASFEREADAAYAALPSFERLVASPLRRCRRLADYIAERTGHAVELDPRMMEMDFGTWEGRAWSDLPRDEIDAWAADFFKARPHGGESVSGLQARVKAAVADHAATGVPTLIVTHAGVIRAALATGETASDFDAKIDFGGFVTMSGRKGAPDE